MGQETLPQNKIELKELIIEIVNEVNKEKIPLISNDEEVEIQELYGDSLEKSRDSDDYESL